MLRIATCPQTGNGDVPVLYDPEAGQWRACPRLTLPQLILTQNPYQMLVDAFRDGRRHRFTGLIAGKDNPGNVRLGKLFGLHQMKGVGEGVLYLASCRTRMDEASAGADLYQRKFWDEIPERFTKFDREMTLQTVGPGGLLGIPAHGKLIVSEMEVCVVPTLFGVPLFFAMSNDLTDSGYERENIINLPPAKMFEGCFSGGPWWTAFSPEELPNGDLPKDMKMTITVARGDNPRWFTGTTGWDQQSRPLPHLINVVGRWLGEQAFRMSVCIQTGTGVAMRDNGHQPGDRITISSSLLGTYTTGIRMVPTWTPAGVVDTFKVSDLESRFERPTT